MISQKLLQDSMRAKSLSNDNYFFPYNQPVMIISSGTTNQIPYFQVQKFVIKMCKEIKSAMVINTAFTYKIFIDIPCLFFLDKQQLWI